MSAQEQLIEGPARNGHSRLVSNSRRPVHVRDVSEELDEQDRREGVAAAFRACIESLSLNLPDPDLAGTDERLARAYAELLSSLRPGSEPHLSPFPNTKAHYGNVAFT